MTPYGDYQVKKVGDQLVVDPIEFITTNWPLLCEIAEIPTLPLVVVDEIPDLLLPPSKFFGGMTLIKEARGHYKVILNSMDLGNDYENMARHGGDSLTILWSGPSTIIRELLILCGDIRRGQLLDIETALLGGLPSHLFPDEPSPELISDPQRVDGWVIQAAIMEYTVGLKDDDRMEESKIHSTIRVKKDDIYKGYF